MRNTLCAPYVGQRVTLLPDEAEGRAEDEVLYAGMGMVIPRRAEPFVVDFGHVGVWIPSGSDRSAHQYIKQLLQEGPDGTDFEGRTLIRGALETARRIGVEGEYGASIAVRAWQVVYEQTPPQERDEEVPERTPVVVSVADDTHHVLATLSEPLRMDAVTARVRFKLYSGDTQVNKLRFLP